MRLDKSSSGTISTAEFLAVPELAMNPLVLRIVAQFDEKENDHINFREFCNTLSVFSPAASKNDKIQFIFDIYDKDHNGVVTAPEMYEILKQMLGNSISTEKMEEIVAISLMELTGNHKAVEVTYAQFYESVKNMDWVKLLSIHF